VKRACFVLCLAVVSALGAGATAARADTAQVAAADVRIGSVAVGGMTAEQAAHAVIAATLRPIVLRLDGHTITVSPSHFHTVAPVGAAVRRALAATPGTAVRFRADSDAAKVLAYVRALAKRFDTKAVPSRFLLRRSRPIVTKSAVGRAIEVDHTRDLIRGEIRDGDRTPIAVPVRVTKPHEAKAPSLLIVIQRGANRLTLYSGTTPVRTFPVATGQASYPTPLGVFQIVVKYKNPTWYPPTQDAWAKGLKPVPPGPDNPLGTRWMGLSSPGIGIHGTDEPASIGYSDSHGCIRMQVPEAEWLFDHVDVGTPVYILAK
jgi:lipoprotein-anchoring transpeptidase ErfK/SrfK